MCKNNLTNKCACGYEGEFDTARMSSFDGYAAIILQAKVSNPEQFHRGAVDLLACPKCDAVKIKRR